MDSWRDIEQTRKKKDDLRHSRRKASIFVPGYASILICFNANKKQKCQTVLFNYSRVGKCSH